MSARTWPGRHTARDTATLTAPTSGAFPACLPVPEAGATSSEAVSDALVVTLIGPDGHRFPSREVAAPADEPHALLQIFVDMVRGAGVTAESCLVCAAARDLVRYTVEVRLDGSDAVLYFLRCIPAPDAVQDPDAGPCGARRADVPRSSVRDPEATP